MGYRVKQWNRVEQAEKLRTSSDFAKAGESERSMAKRLGVPRTTVQHWRGRKAANEAPAVVVEFFESPEGTVILHQLLMGAHFVITLLGSGGIRLVCQFLELSGLSAFVASSYGVQQRINAALEEAVVEHARTQREQLTQDMPTKTITVCEDETFHPDICLVGLEAVSNFILLEEYAENRSAQTWTSALQSALEGLPVEVIQATSDEAKGLRRHAQHDLGAHHAPDLFHVQHEVVKATGVMLARQVRHAEQTVVDSTEALNKHRQAAVDYRSARRRPPGRPPAFGERISQAHQQLVEAELDLEEAQDRKAEAGEQIREIGAAYHPYRLETGQAQSVEDVSHRLEACWERLNEIAQAADLPERCVKKLRKARRVTGDLLSTVGFFFATIQAKIEALNLTPEIEEATYRYLIPAIYLDRVAEKTQDREQRGQLRQRVAVLLASVEQAEGALSRLDNDERHVLEQVAVECAELFQRSSSCVEGRNGQLALQHHARHRLTNRKLAALTAVHNYYIRRPDGTTAAERFFGRRPAPLFDVLLDKVPLPGRPARKRPRPPKPPYLQPIAA
jgi:hypothetical protein